MPSALGPAALGLWAYISAARGLRAYISGKSLMPMLQLSLVLILGYNYYLNTLTKWADHWLIKFNIPKCKIMQITTHYNQSNFTYKMCTNYNNNIPQTNYYLTPM